jgi:hypothetical protein
MRSIPLRWAALRDQALRHEAEIDVIIFPATTTSLASFASSLPASSDQFSAQRCFFHNVECNRGFDNQEEQNLEVRISYFYKTVRQSTSISSVRLPTYQPEPERYRKSTTGRLWIAAPCGCPDAGEKVESTDMASRRLWMACFILFMTLLTGGDGIAAEAEKRHASHARSLSSVDRAMASAQQPARLGPIRYYGGPKSPIWRAPAEN